MIDTDKYEGLIEDIDMIINAEEIGVDDLLADCMVLKDGITELLAEVKRLREQYLELRDALVGDTPNWTHEELVEHALDLTGQLERALELVGEEECTNKAQDN